MTLYPDGLADALAYVIAEKEREFEKLLQAQAAEHRAAFAEFRAQVAEQQLLERKRIDEFEQIVRGYEGIITHALANVQDGKEGPAGRDGATGGQGPAGEKGEKGDRGEKGDPGEGIAGAAGLQGERGDKGDPGRDGLPGVPGRDGRDGLDGKDGAPGIGFDSWDVEYDGERTVTFICGNGELQARKSVTLPVQIHRGVFDIARPYSKHDVVTWGGSQWIADKDTTGVQPDSLKARDWTMVVRKGRDGKDGKPGEKGEPGAQGRPGLDLTQMDSAGNKWR